MLWLGCRPAAANLVHRDHAELPCNEVAAGGTLVLPVRVSEDREDVAAIWQPALMRTRARPVEANPLLFGQICSATARQVARAAR